MRHDKIRHYAKIAYYDIQIMCATVIKCMMM